MADQSVWGLTTGRRGAEGRVWRVKSLMQKGCFHHRAAIWLPYVGQCRGGALADHAVESENEGGGLFFLSRCSRCSGQAACFCIPWFLHVS